MMAEILRRLRLNTNPFEPAATGAPLFGTLAPPANLATKTMRIVEHHKTGQGAKAIVIVGEYGSGKTCLLQWLHGEVFPGLQIKSFYFHDPGVQFYDLANRLLSTIGRKNFAKFIWELAGSNVTGDPQGQLFHGGYEDYLTSWFRHIQKKDMTGPIQDAIIRAEITTDEQIAYCLAKIVTETPKKPYFEYRDFMPRHRGSVVAEEEEAPYFRAILKTISNGMNANAIVLLIDEFEEIGLQKRLTKRAAHDYLATMRRLINLARSDQVDFWIVLSMTPDAYKTTKELEPSLIQRVSDQTIEIDPLSRDDAFNLMRTRIEAARTPQVDPTIGMLFPFPDDVVFRPDTFSNPRRLVKACFQSIAESDFGTRLPYTREYLHGIEDEIHSTSTDTGHSRK